MSVAFIFGKALVGFGPKPGLGYIAGMEWVIALVLKPFVALALFVFAYLVAQLLSRAIPEGRAKALLYDRTLQKRHPWKFGLGFLFGSWGLIGIIAVLVT